MSGHGVAFDFKNSRSWPPLRPLRVCALGLRGIPGVLGGVEVHCEELYPRLAALDPRLELTVIARKDYAPHAPTTFRNVAVVALPALRHSYLEAITHSFMAVLYARFRARADIVHIHAIGPALVTPLAKLLGLKVVVTHHGRDYVRPKWNKLARWALKLGEEFAARFADQVLVVSPTMTRALQERFPARAGRIIWAPNGAPSFEAQDSEAEAQILARFGLQRGGYVLAAGRLVPSKGFHDLIAAMAQAGIPQRLVIAGDVNFENDYSKSLRQTGGDDVTFAGFLNRTDLFVLYRNASVFVLPSHHEGLSIAVLEAAAAGAPILISDIEPNLDFQLPEVNYFPVGDVARLAEKLRADHRSYAIDTAKFIERHSWDRAAAATAQAYWRAEGLDVGPVVWREINELEPVA